MLLDQLFLCYSTVWFYATQLNTLILLIWMIHCYLIKLLNATWLNAFVLLKLMLLCYLTKCFCAFEIQFYLFCFTYLLSYFAFSDALSFTLLFFFPSSYLTTSTAYRLMRNASILPRYFHHLLFYFHDTLFIYLFVFFYYFFLFLFLSYFFISFFYLYTNIFLERFSIFFIFRNHLLEYGKPVSFLLKLQFAIADKVVLSKIKAKVSRDKINFSIFYK